MARNIRGLAKHIAQIMDVWEGSDCTLKVKTAIVDDDGQVTGQDYDDYTITGSFPAVKNGVTRDDAGWIEDDEITAYFPCSGYYPSEDDRIVHKGVWYEVAEIPVIDYDGEIPVGCKCILRRVPIES